MHQDPEHEDYDDDDYKQYPDQYDKYGSYKGFHHQFKFDYLALENWLHDAMKQIVEEDKNVWSFKFTPVTGLPSTTNASKNKYFMYLGNNQYEEAVWKKKYFAKKALQVEYNNHISFHAAHFLKQPSYYKGMFDILN